MEKRNPDVGVFAEELNSTAVDGPLCNPVTFRILGLNGLWEGALRFEFKGMNSFIVWTPWSEASLAYFLKACLNVANEGVRELTGSKDWSMTCH